MLRNVKYNQTVVNSGDLIDICNQIITAADRVSAVTGTIIRNTELMEAMSFDDFTVVSDNLKDVFAACSTMTSIGHKLIDLAGDK